VHRRRDHPGLAEYDMNAWDGLDFYDVSMVDGSNMAV
jgi:hypothetical protein